MNSSSERYRDGERGRPAEPLDHEVADERPDHVQVAVGEVQQLQHAVDHRVAERDQGVQAALGDPVHQFLEEEMHALRVLCATLTPGRGARPYGARRGAATGSADHELVTRTYLPCWLILNRNHLAPIRSPLESKWIGCPRIEVGSAVCLDRRQHGRARRRAGLAGRGDRLVDHVRRRVDGRSERPELRVRGLGRGHDRRRPPGCGDVRAERRDVRARDRERRGLHSVGADDRRVLLLLLRGSCRTARRSPRPATAGRPRSSPASPSPPATRSR